MDLILERIDIPEGCNIIFGMSHFIKTVEDLYEVMVNSVPGIKFGLAFNEASGPCLVRKDGTKDNLILSAAKNLKRIGAGHTFLIIMEDAFPINVLPAIKNCREIVNIFCATSNNVQVILTQTEQGRGVLGVIDGESPKGVELDTQVTQRKQLLVDLGYKR